MILIAMLFPAMIYMLIGIKRKILKADNMAEVIAEYGCAVLVCNILVMLVLIYGLGMDDLKKDVFDNFSFFLKYTVMSSAVAGVVPYIREVCQKYIQIRFHIEKGN